MSFIIDNMPKILAHIQTVYKDQIIYQQKLLEIYEGSIEKYLLESMRTEFSERAFNRAKERIAPINIIPKVINKISGVYNCGAHREVAGNDFDTANVAYFEQDLALDSVMDLANQYLNLFRHCAIEPYIYRGKPEIRVIPPTGFTVWTNDQVNPLIPKVFVKFVGKAQELVWKPRTDRNGVAQGQPEQVLDDVDIYHIYTDEEFLIVSSAGTVRRDLMGDSDGTNPYGVIPFVYLSTSKNLLIPLPNSDMFKIGVLIPKLLTDINYATKFQSHAIMYTIDIESSQLDGNPDTMWELKSKQNADGTQAGGTVGTIKPEVDIDKVMTLIKETLTIWFDSLGIKASGINNISASSASSGIAKAIDESDTSEVIRDQMPIMRKAEVQLWNLLSNQFGHWTATSVIDIDNFRPFSSDFAVSVKYKEKEIKPDPKSQVELAALKVEKGLTSKRRALRIANPELSDEEITELILEIEAEKMIPTLIKEDEKEDEKEDMDKEDMDKEDMDKEDMDKEDGENSTETEPTTEPVVDNIQQTALNGAQVASLIQVVEQMKAGTITRDQAQSLIRAAFPSLVEEDVKGILG